MKEQIKVAKEELWIWSSIRLSTKYKVSAAIGEERYQPVFVPAEDVLDLNL